MTTAALVPLACPALLALEAWAHADTSYEVTFDVDAATLTKVWFTVRAKWADVSTPDDTSALVQVTLGQGITVTGTKTAKITLTAAKVAAIAPGVYPCDLKTLSSAGGIELVSRGELRLNPVATVSQS